MPGYKTKLCTNFETEGTCEYDEMCHYAHGEEELREETEIDKEMAIQNKIKKNPYYKTIMCKTLQDCQYAENCVYAHSEAELRPLSQNMGVKHFGAGPPEPFPMRGGYKSTLCKNFSESGSCSFGPKCTFAHGQAEIRSNANSNIMVQGPDGKIKFKTVMCTVFMEKGFCTRGDFCGFAHSAKQLLEAQARDPKYKTTLCEAWKAEGSCERGNNCIYAHGEKDLRTGPTALPPMSTAYPPQYSKCS